MSGLSGISTGMSTGSISKSMEKTGLLTSLDWSIFVRVLCVGHSGGNASGSIPFHVKNKTSVAASFGWEAPV